MDNLITAAGKSEEAKTTKRVATIKTPTKKNPAQLTATDQVLTIIKKSKKGINIKTLMEKTGFKQKKRLPTSFRGRTNRVKSKEWERGYIIGRDRM